MPIKFDCPECGRTVRAPDHIAGKKTRCPGCTQVILIPKGEDPGFEIVEEDGSPAIEQSEKSAVERRPCPACGEMIAVKARKCRFCSEVFDGRSRKKERGQLRRKYNSQMNGLGGLWIFFGGLALLMLIMTSCVEPPPGMRQPAVFFVIVGLITLGWLVAGIATCFKQRWAVYVGLSLSYLNSIGSLFSLFGAGNAANPAPPGFTAGMVIGVLIMVVGIIQGHRVNAMAKRLNAADDE